MISKKYSIRAIIKIPENLQKNNPVTIKDGFIINEDRLNKLLENFILESPLQLAPFDRISIWDNPNRYELMVYKRIITQMSETNKYDIIYEFVFATDAPFEVSWSTYPEYNK